MKPIPEAIILVVDDLSSMRRIITNMLHELGCKQILMAENGQQALSTIRSKSVDIVLTDWNMPTMNGFELLLAVRNNPQTAKLPVVFVTANATGEQVLMAKQNGANGYIVKPFTPAVLKQHITLAITSQNGVHRPLPEVRMPVGEA